MDGNSIIYAVDSDLSNEIPNVADEFNGSKTTDCATQSSDNVFEIVNHVNQPEIVEPSFMTLTIEPAVDVFTS